MESDTEPSEPASLRLLRRLVTLLTVAMILAVLTVTALFVIRFGSLRSNALPELPAAVQIPQGENAGAVTFGKGWVAVVTVDGAGAERIRVFSNSGVELGELEIAAR